MELNKIYEHNVLNPWPLPDQCLNCIVTSPPYWGLRDYGVIGQIGLEGTIDEWLQKMVQVFREAWRVLKDDGTLWVNIGDTYSTAGKWGGKSSGKHLKSPERGDFSRPDVIRDFGSLKSKDLIGMPWMLAFALRADGWYLRQDIVWHKPNPMPESVRDRCTRSHEFIFMFSKKPKYYYNAHALRTPAVKHSFNSTGFSDGTKNDGRKRGASKRHHGLSERWDHMTLKEQQAGGANKRNVWTVSTAGFSEAHFATFPEDLIVDCIRAGCPPGGTVGDCFFGSGTTGLVARKNGRNFIGMDLNPKYIKLADRRLKKELGLFY